MSMKIGYNQNSSIVPGITYSPFFDVIDTLKITKLLYRDDVKLEGQDRKLGTISYGTVGALVDPVKFLDYIYTNTGFGLKNLFRNKNHACDVDLDCYVITSKAKLIGILSENMSKTDVKSKQLFGGKNDLLSDFDAPLYRNLIEGNIFSQTGEVVDNQAMCMGSLDITNANATQITWCKYNVDQSSIEYADSWTVSEEATFMDFSNHYYPCSRKRPIVRLVSNKNKGLHQFTTQCG